MKKGVILCKYLHYLQMTLIHTPQLYLSTSKNKAKKQE